MIKGLIYLIITSLVLTFFSMPWLSSAVYIATSILQPQTIWFWSFEGIPAFKISAGLAILGFIVMALRKEIDWSVYKYKQNYAIFFLWVLVNLSEQLSPFPVYSAGVSSTILIGTFNTIVLMYFVLLGTLNNFTAIKVASFLFVGIVIYYTYWANNMYLDQQWSQFYNNRLRGPVNSPYRDGNVLAVMYIIGYPFLLMGFFYFKSKILKYSICLVIPLLWHAVLLTGSRGALLALSVVSLACALIIKSKSLNILLLSGFVIFVITQGQFVIDRSYDTYSDIKNETTEVANPRFLSWAVGRDIALKKPLLGVGPQRFQTAARTYFPGRTKHVAHNTLISVAANIGIPAMLCFLVLITSPIKRLKIALKTETEDEDEQLKLYKYIISCSSFGILGYVIASIFLDLMIYEIFYFALLMNLICYHKIKSRQMNSRPNLHKPKKVNTFTILELGK